MHPLYMATFMTHDLAQATSSYVELFDYQTIERGTISEDLATFWQSPDSAGAPYATFAPSQGSDGGRVRLIERRELTRQVPFQRYGWCGVEFVVQDVLALQKRLQDSAIEVLMDPKPPWAPMAAIGPSGEGWLFNTPAENNPFNYTVLPAQSFVDRISIIVCACKDRSASEAFYSGLLGAKPGHRAEMPLPFANTAMKLPDSTTYKTGAMRLGRMPFIELDEYPHTVENPADDFETGLVLATLQVPSLDDTNISFLSEPSIVEASFYNGKRCALCRGPDGELIELIES